jgi:hypothetical protein
MVYAEEEYESNGIQASSRFNPNCVGLSDREQHMTSITFFIYKHFNQPHIIFGAPNFMRKMYSTSLLKESWDLLKSVNRL